MDGRQIVLVLTAEFSVLNTEIFQLEALSRFTVFTQLQSRMSSCLSSTLSLSKILFLPTYVIYLFTLIYLNVVWSLKNLFFTTDIITIYYFNSILYYMLYDNIILKLIRKYNILWIRKINVFQLYFCHCNRSTYIGRSEKNVKQHLSWNNNMLCIKKNKCFSTVLLLSKKSIKTDSILLVRTFKISSPPESIQ
jgi:hypothetical protein